MIMKSKELIALTAALTMAAAANAQTDGGFDLGSQRKEKQSWQQVPGHKIDHKGMVISPTPKSIITDESKAYAFPSGKKAPKVKDVQKAFSKEIYTLLPKDVDLTIDFGAKAAAKAGVEAKDGAYVLTINKKGITITGYNERGAFYGLQTLRQILESEKASKGSLPYMTIVDSPDLNHRGVVEGFYGNPWSHEVRLSLIDFYGRNKMNSYVYGPKDDPYHSSPNWRLPYPAEEARNIKDLVKACEKARVNFIWAIHPGKDIQWNEEDYQNLVKKFDMMYGLGVRSFAIFFDDIEGEGTDPNKQVELLNRLTNEYVKTREGVQPLIICPTDYSRAWAGTSPNSALPTYGRTLDPSVEVFYTGDAVCSDLTRDTMDFFDGLIKRPGFYWWNFPVTDYARHILMQGPTYGLDPTLTSAEVSGIVSNPMEQGEASKLALYGVADYSWNTKDYNPIDNWERALTEVAPEVRDAYRTFAIHSCDTETGYRRDESWETETFSLNEYTPAKAAALKDEFEKISRVPAEMEEGCKDQLLLSEIRPWLTEFGKLGQRGVKTIELIEAYRQGNDSLFWNEHIINEFTPEQRAEWEKHKSGTMKLQPFMDFATDDMVRGFYTRVAGKNPATLKPIGSYPNLATTLSKSMLDGNPGTFWTSARGQRDGEWVGVDLGDIRKVENVFIKQGRNSTDDVDYYDHCILQASPDGKEWINLTEPMEKTYDISWTGTPVDARYVRLLRLDSKKRNWMSVRQFIVNPMTEGRVPVVLEPRYPKQILNAFDSDPETTADLPVNSVVGFAVNPGEMTILSNASAANPLTVMLVQVSPMKKKDIAPTYTVDQIKVDTPYRTITIPAGVSSVGFKNYKGDIKIHEVLMK